MSAAREFERIVHPREFGFTATNLERAGPMMLRVFCGSRSCSSSVEPLTSVNSPVTAIG